MRSVHTSKCLKENSYLDISCSDNSSQYQSVSIDTVQEEDEDASESKVNHRRTSDKSIDDTCNKIESLSVKCSSNGLINNSLRSSERKVSSTKTGATKQRKSTNAKYHTLPVSSGKNRSNNIIDNGNKGSTLVHSNVTTNGTNVAVKSELMRSLSLSLSQIIHNKYLPIKTNVCCFLSESVIRSWLSRFGKKPPACPVAVDQSTQTDIERPISCSSVNHHCKCVKCAPVDYCCISPHQQQPHHNLHHQKQQQQQSHYQQLITSNCIQCASTLLVPSVMNNFTPHSRQFTSTNDETGEISETIIHPCTTFYYAEPVDPSCLGCIATCPPSLIHCPGGYKYTAGATFTSSSCNSSCSSSSNSSGSSDICQTNSSLAAAAAAASTTTTTTSTGVLQRDMYCWGYNTIKNQLSLFSFLSLSLRSEGR